MSDTPTVEPKKKRTRTKKTTTIQDEFEILMNEVEDVNIEEASSGIPFIRRGFVECIDSLNHENDLIVNKVYRVQEIHEDNDKLYIQAEDGDHHWYPSRLFKAIDYGPFRKSDEVQLLGLAGVEAIKGQLLEDYVHHNTIVKEATDTHAIVEYGNGIKYKVPNANLRLQKRYTTLSTPNPFVEGDKVRAIKSDYRIYVGSLYTVIESQGDHIRLAEDPEGNRFYHIKFKKYEEPKKKKKEKKVVLSLKDYVREFYNKHSYEKLTPSKLVKYMRESNVPKELFNEEEIVKCLKELNKTMFTW